MSQSLAPTPTGPVDAIASIRTLALTGPAGAGKTTLAEALLLKTGAIKTAGSVEKGSTVSDDDPQERRMQHSLQTSMLHAHHDGLHLQMLDTPGSPDFIGQALPALEAVETVAVVINAQTGIELMALRLMEAAARRGLTRMLIINKIDVPGVDLASLLSQVQQTFGRECLPMNLPAQAGTGVQDCFFGTEGETDFGSVADAHRALVEQVVEVDPAFVDRYLNDGDVPATELHTPLEQALREGHLIPVCFVSARTGAGVAELLGVIEKLLPNPTEANPPQFLQGEGEEAQPLQVAMDPERHVVAHVFKILSDPYLGKLAMVRVHQGTLRRNAQVFVGHARKPVRLAHLLRLQGRQHVDIDQALPGELCALAKLDDLHFDAVLHDAPEDEHLHLSPVELPVAVHGLSLRPTRHGDEQRLWDVLARLVEEDPCLRLERAGEAEGGAGGGNAQGGETLVYGLGDLHLRCLLERLKDPYKVEVVAQPPRVAYRETIAAAAEGHHRHKKQTGGAGQFGEVWLRVEPLARGAGFEFRDEVKGGAIPGAFMPAVEKGVRQALARGVVAGYPLQDLRVTVLDGKHHTVDSKEVAFITAARKALMAAVKEARPLVLEPIVTVEITAPESATGDITGDLAARRGQVSGTRNPVTGQIVVLGSAPLAELSAYQNRLNALTSGQGRYTLAFSHHEAVPPSVQAQLISQHRVQDDE
ncbi:elongation factor G [Roseateles terrae]|uniref:Elongation factor G n=1 Tax=Roseateles terrae TaxID=431060 RepID=A0ABR6GYR5_9BURK|nr:elongation factor G [Roseateles terrae]MBB3197200.1 elongation factor G [Roseateles terrae]OWQ83731.1 elongation factor G [Roseateles terrae]